MNKKLVEKLGLDIVMTLIMIVLMGYMTTGVFWHEILGVGALLMIISHNIINIKWIKSMAKSLGKPLGYKAYIKIVINILMACVTVVLAVSSILISKSLFIFLGIRSGGIWKYLHTICAYGLLIIISLHIGIHWKMIMNAMRNMFHIQEKNTVRNVILRVLALILAILGVKASFDRGIATKFIPSNMGNRPDRNEMLDMEKIGESPNKGTIQDQEEIQNNQIKSNGYSDIEVKQMSFKQIRGGAAGGHGHDTVERSFTDEVIEEGDSVEDFLGRLVCTGCGKQCSLLSPQCGTGATQAQNATSYFESAGTQDQDDQSSSVGGGEAKITFELDAKAGDSLFGLFTDYIPIMGLYIAGTYYLLEIIDKAKKKNK